MSARSDAWYAVPQNQEKRKRNMRVYQLALTELGQRHGTQRRRAYQLERAAGAGGPSAASRARAVVRDAHPAEFREILARLRGA